jgi:DNA-directed RNA polymerase alpha subunit
MMSDQHTPFPKISGPANDALTHAGYTHMEQLAQVTEKDILALHGFGKKGMETLRKAMADKGIAFAPPKQK